MEGYSQQVLPPFKPEAFELKMPVFMPGLMNDPSATRVGDTLICKYQGQLFTDKQALLGSLGSKNRNTPWEVVDEMTEAYMKKDATKINSLYNEASKSQIENMTIGANANQYLEYVGKAKNVRLLGGIEYGSGFMVFSSDDTYGMHENYLVKEKGKYRIAALDDKSTVSWNMGVYLKCKPQPMRAITGLTFPDSAKMSDSLLVEANVKENYWVECYFGDPGNLIPIRIMDNGPGDLDPQLGKVRLYIKASLFGIAGTYDLYIASFNYQILQVAKSLMTVEAKYHVKFY
jgi:hypothetical protein